MMRKPTQNQIDTLFEFLATVVDECGNLNMCRTESLLTVSIGGKVHQTTIEDLAKKTKSPFIQGDAV